MSNSVNFKIRAYQDLLHVKRLDRFPKLEVLSWEYSKNLRPSDI